jgi:nucleoside-diphosphate-sugar epimerase
MAAALEGSGKALVVTSGTATLAAGRYGSEHDAPAPGSAGGMRAPAEAIVMTSAERGVRGVVMRLPPSVHGAGDHGFVPMLIAVARRTGVAGYIDDGGNRWPAVHRLDAARVFHLALEKALPGTRLHAAAEEGIAMRAIAAAIGEGLRLPVRSIATDEAAAHFGFLAHFVGVDNPVHSALTREALGWQPQHAGLLDDMRAADYFA